jgi:electron transfer flavoprotein alpha subunit
MPTLVYVEDHEGELSRGSLGVLSHVAGLEDEVAAALCGSGVKELAGETGRYGAARALVADDPALEHPLPQPRVDVLAKLVGDAGFDAVVFAASVLTADVAAGLAARLGAGLNWDLVGLERKDGELVGKRPALQDSVFVDVGWKGEPRIALIRSGTWDAAEKGGEAEVEEVPVELQDFSQKAVMLERAHAESEGPSIEEADVIVAGGRGLGEPRHF